MESDGNLTSWENCLRSLRCQDTVSNIHPGLKLGQETCILWFRSQSLRFLDRGPHGKQGKHFRCLHHGEHDLSSWWKFTTSTWNSDILDYTKQSNSCRPIEIRFQSRKNINSPMEIYYLEVYVVCMVVQSPFCLIAIKHSFQSSPQSGSYIK